MEQLIIKISTNIVPMYIQELLELGNCGGINNVFRQSVPIINRSNGKEPGVRQAGRLWLE